MIFCQHLSVAERLHRDLLEKNNRKAIAALRIQCCFQAYLMRSNLNKVVTMGKAILTERKGSLVCPQATASQ